jgi:hypothetical protein
MKRTTRAGGAIAAACLLAATACSSDGDDTTSETAPTTEEREATPSTAAPTTAPPATTEPKADEPSVTTPPVASTIPPSTDTVEVPFYVIDASIPPGLTGLTCATALPGFNVSFSDESGATTIVEARVRERLRENSGSYDADAVVNATCIDDLADGVPALFYAAVLDVPAAEIYESIELRYPFANGAGNDMFCCGFEMVPQAEAEAGIGIKVQGGGGGDVPLNSSEIDDFPPAD